MTLNFRCGFNVSPECHCDSVSVSGSGSVRIGFILGRFSYRGLTVMGLHLAAIKQLK